MVNKAVLSQTCLASRSAAALDPCDQARLTCGSSKGGLMRIVVPTLTHASPVLTAWPPVLTHERSESINGV